jgi:hypothetical protein
MSAKLERERSEMEKEVKRRRCKVGKLTTVGQVAAELGRLYRLTRWGQVETQDASRLVTILSAMRQCLEASDIERRLAELEALDAKEAAGDNVVPFKGRA